MDKTKAGVRPKAKILRAKKIPISPSPVAVQNPEVLNQVIEQKVTEFKQSNLVAREFKNNFDQKVTPYTQVTFPIQPDYHVQLELFKLPKQSKESVYEALYTYWGMIHILSLGIIPITKMDQFNIRTTLFDKIGQVIRQKQTLNESRIWYWSPLLFFKGIHTWSTFREIHSSDIEIDSTSNTIKFPTTFLR